MQNELDTNKPGWDYEWAWTTLFEQLPTRLKLKVLQANGCDDKDVPPEVKDFIKRVIAMAERDQ